jgi:rhamnosyltransferase subunit B
MSKASKKKIVLNTFGALGDLHPYVAPGIELQKRGYDVLLAANSSHRKIVESESLAFHAIAPDISDFGDELEIMRRVMDLKSGPEYAVRELLLPNLGRSYFDLTTACADASLLVSHPTTFAARIVAEKLIARGMN